jgi:putative membrane protein
MKSQIILPTALLAMLALAACSKPASQTATDTATTTTAAAQDATGGAVNATANATDGGGAVSPPAANGAVNADANKSSADVASASNSFTEGQAKGHIQNAGYADVSGLTKTPDGLWTATATKGGKPVTVVVDFKGAVTTK